MIIKHVNNNELTESQVNQMIEVFQNEAVYGRQVSEKVEQQYLHDLKKWQEELEHVIKHIVPQYREKQEGLANGEDYETGESLLQELNNL